MTATFGPIILGIFLCILGRINMKGNISSVHRYHRHRLTEVDKAPFGRLVGLGTLIIGISLIALGCLSLLTELTQNEIFVLIGSVIVVIGIAVGLGMSFYAMLKYNKGIF